MRRTTLTLAFILVCGCGAATAANPQPAPATASPVALSCTASGSASSSWPSGASVTGRSPGIISAVTDGDTLKLMFVLGTPQFAVDPVGSAHFAVDPSGRPVVLAGNSGVRIVLRGFRGGVSNYSGTGRLTSSGPILLEAGAIGDFEGVVTFGAGVSRSACANVTANGSTLTFHFIPAP